MATKKKKNPVLTKTPPKGHFKKNIDQHMKRITKPTKKRG